MKHNTAYANVIPAVETPIEKFRRVRNITPGRVYFKRPARKSISVMTDKPMRHADTMRHITRNRPAGDGLTNHQRVIANRKAQS